MDWDGISTIPRTVVAVLPDIPAWAAISPMPGDYMICTAMSGNGVWTGWTTWIPHPPPIPRVLRRATSVSSVAADGSEFSARRSIAVRRVAPSPTEVHISAAQTAVSASPCHVGGRAALQRALPCRREGFISLSCLVFGRFLGQLGQLGQVGHVG